MGRTLAALTGPAQNYPGYVNVTQEDDGAVVLTVRGDPKVRDGVFLCGYAPQDTGKLGRCTPGDSNCNNYCNMAPEKGPMAPAAKPCQQVLCGETVSLRLTPDQYTELLAQLVTLP